jgi:hypothetical protein
VLKPDPCAEIEDVLMRLMPVALSEGVQSEIDSEIDGLCGDMDLPSPNTVNFPRWIAASGIAAALVLGFAFYPRAGKTGGGISSRQPLAAVGSPGVVVLDEAERVERVSDDGLFVDSGGSAVRKVRVHLVGESRMRDEETGIVVTLREPREETYLVPVSTF